MFICNICETEFTSKPNMYRHRKHVCLPKQNIMNSQNESHEHLIKIKELEFKLKEYECKNIELVKNINDLKVIETEYIDNL